MCWCLCFCSSRQFYLWKPELVIWFAETVSSLSLYYWTSKMWSWDWAMIKISSSVLKKVVYEELYKTWGIEVHLVYSTVQHLLFSFLSLKLQIFNLMHFFLSCGVDAFPSNKVICSGCSWNCFERRVSLDIVAFLSTTLLKLASCFSHCSE